MTGHQQSAESLEPLPEPRWYHIKIRYLDNIRAGIRFERQYGTQGATRRLEAEVRAFCDELVARGGAIRRRRVFHFSNGIGGSKDLYRDESEADPRGEPGHGNFVWFSWEYEVENVTPLSGQFEPPSYR